MFADKKIHLIGIGGISMSSIALMLLNMKVQISGSDVVESNLTKKLIDMGANIKYGHHPELIEDADIVVYTAAISESDPERVAAKNLNKPYFERAEFLGKLMKEFRNCLCVSGTHGKSTTTGMLASIFLTAEKNPTIQVGAIYNEIGGNTKIGSHEYFILEACEYVDSFLHFYPTAAIITNIDNDHLDYFKNLNNIKKSFAKYVSLLPENGYLVYNSDDDNSKDLPNHTKAKVITYAINNPAMYTAKNIKVDTYGHHEFDLYKDNNFITHIKLNITGPHNIYNALAAFALSSEYIDDVDQITKGIEKYRGVGRRFEYLGEYNGAKVFDDYAHHPTEIATTYDSCKEIKNAGTWAVFGPHTYSRTKAHLDNFAKILSKFNHILILPIYAAREKDNLGISSLDLVNKIKELNPNAIFVESYDEALEYLKNHVKPNELVISIGAADVYKITHQLVKTPEEN